MKNKPLNVFNIAFMYVGTVIGAGFASGREVWQYFGLFGPKAYLGLALACVFFVSMGAMIAYLGRTLNTHHMGKIILPVRNELLSEILSYIVALFIYMPLVAMSAAGGSLLKQQFNITPVAGGIVVVTLTILTVLGDFQRVSKVFRVIMPVLFSIVVILCFYVIFRYQGRADIPEEIKPSPMAKIWPFSALVYVAYNIMGTIPIMSQSSIRGKSKKISIIGASLGGVFLSFLALILVVALQRDPLYSSSLDLPLLGYAGRESGWVSAIFALVLFASIYSASTSTYYGFCSRLKEDKYKKIKVIFFAVLGFFLGLVGFKNLVAYVYPLEGYCGIFIMLLITINFIRVYRESRSQNKGVNI